MRVGSLFSGVGGLDLGLERAGHSIVWQVEFDKQARSVLRRHWPGVPIYEDVKDVGRTTKPDTTERPTGPDCVIRKAGSNIGGVFGGHGDAADGRPRTTLAPVDLICGGFPCQDLSVAGGRKGLAGARSGLWWEFHRIIGELSPTWVLIENVPGLLSSNEGRDMGVIVHGLEELGYGWSYRILDSQYFGVPQRRRRVFIVGHSGGVCGPEILLECESVYGDIEEVGEAGEAVAGTSGEGSQGPDIDSPIVLDRASFNQGENAQYEPSVEESETSPSLVARGLHAVMKAHGFGKYTEEGHTGPLRAVGQDNADADLVLAHHGQGGAELTADKSPTLSLIHEQPIVYRKAQKAHDPDDCERWEEAEYANTLNGQGDTARTVPLVGAMPRRLTPRECERLQGFPDDWPRRSEAG